MDNLIDSALKILDKPLESMDMSDLATMTRIKSKISYMIPFAKKDHKLKELSTDTLEKTKLIEYKKAKKDWKTTMTEQDMKALARLERNKLEIETIDLEFTYLQLYNLHTELQDKIVSARLFLKQ